MLTELIDQINTPDVSDASQSKVKIEIIKNDTKNETKNDTADIKSKDKNNFNKMILDDVKSQHELLINRFKEIKERGLNDIYNENKKFIDYFHEKYDTDIYGDNTSDMELKNLKKKQYIYLNSTESIEDYNRGLLNVLKSYDDKKKKEKELYEQKLNTLSYGLCSGAIDNEIDPKEYIRKNVFTVLMPGIQELLSTVKKNEEGIGKEIKDPINWLANYLKKNNPNKTKKK